MVLPSCANASGVATGSNASMAHTDATGSIALAYPPAVALTFGITSRLPDCRAPVRPLASQQPFDVGEPSRVEHVAFLEPPAACLADPEFQAVEFQHAVRIRIHADEHALVLRHSAMHVREVEPLGMSIELQ